MKPLAQVKEEALKNKHDKKPLDLDPEGEQYVNTEKPLEDALQFVKPLELLAPHNLEVQSLCFEVYIRQQKYLLVLKALSKLTQHQQFKTYLDRFNDAVKNHKDLDPKIKQVIDLQLAEINKA